VKVLLVDDDPDQLAIRAMLLAQSGFQTISAADAGAALAAAVAQKPACALIDLRLPTEADGLRLIRTLKETDPAILLIVLTGGNPAKLKLCPESKLIEEVIVKGGSSAYLVGRLRSLARRARS